MISLSSFLRFCFSNIFLFTLASYEHYHTNELLNNSLLYQICAMCSMGLFRNYFLFNTIKNLTKNHISINNNEKISPKEDYPNQFTFDFIRITLIESIGTFFIPYILTIKNTYQENHFYSYFYEWFLFLFASFYIEIMFDLFHYLNHRLLHEIPFLYKNFHKYHHQHHHPNLMTTYHHNSFDFIFTNTLPLYISIYLYTKLFPLTLFQLKMIVIMKVAVELFGHCGKDIYKTGSFFQCMWFPKIFGFELYVKDHDLHHSKNNCNYAKRFALWDMVLNTYHKD